MCVSSFSPLSCDSIDWITFGFNERTASFTYIWSTYCPRTNETMYITLYVCDFQFCSVSNLKGGGQCLKVIEDFTLDDETSF